MPRLRPYATFATAIFAIVGVAHAQEGAFGGAPTGVPMPSPMDRIFDAEPVEQGACGKDAYNPVWKEVQAVYGRAGRCAAFDQNGYRDFALWTRTRHDPDDGRRYGGGVIGDYENVPSYFAYYGIAWWDGTTSPGYRETARYGDQLAPGLAPPPSAARRPAPSTGAGAAASGSSSASTGNVGACGLPILSEEGRKAQAVLADQGQCGLVGGRPQ